MSSAYESCMCEMDAMQRKITSLTAENEMLRNNVAMRINGQEEIERLAAQVDALTAELAEARSADISSREMVYLDGTGWGINALRKAIIRADDCECEKLREELAEAMKQQTETNADWINNQFKLEDMTKERDRYREALERIAEGHYALTGRICNEIAREALERIAAQPLAYTADIAREALGK